MSRRVFRRRDFLGVLGALGSAPLIGAETDRAPLLPRRAASVTGPVNSVIIPTHEWAGELDERLDFPGDWQIEVLRMKGHAAPVLTAQQIAERLEKPIDTPPLREIVAGKKRVAVTFDDLTRPTPASTVMPWVVSELKAGGIKDEAVLLIAAYGSHRAMTHAEVQQKLGRAVANQFAWLNHNVFENVKEVGVTSFKNHVKLNQNFLAAEAKICVSGVKAHEQAGVSGGAKAILPGVAALDTIEYNHRVILPSTKTAGTFKVFKNEMRLDMIEAARMVNVDFSIQILFNQKRRPVHVFSGDIVGAHHAAARAAVNHYVTPTLKDADIVVSNAYPVNNQAFRARWWIDRAVREGGTGVLIIQHPLGLDPVHWLSARISGRDGSTYFDMMERRRKSRLPRNTRLIIYSQYLSRVMINEYPPQTRFATRWDEVIEMLRRWHKGQPRVAVYPYGGIQEEVLSLDG